MRDIHLESSTEMALASQGRDVEAGFRRMLAGHGVFVPAQFSCCHHPSGSDSTLGTRVLRDHCQEGIPLLCKNSNSKHKLCQKSSTSTKSPRLGAPLWLTSLIRNGKHSPTEYKDNCLLFGVSRAGSVLKSSFLYNCLT